jgi:type II secretory pathway pseudopilin PulG
MKTPRPTHRIAGLTVVEVILVMACLAILAALLLPALAPARVRPRRISCINNLKQIGLALRMWSNDHHDEFPWQVSRTNGGTLEFVGSGAVYPHFAAISNELVSPKPLACSTDTARSKTADWNALTSHLHLSYFAGLDANEGRPQSLLSGDRNVTGGTFTAGNILLLASNTPVGFGTNMHNGSGNVGLGDGSAQQVLPVHLQAQLQSALQEYPRPHIRLAIPR